IRSTSGPNPRRPARRTATPSRARPLTCSSTLVRPGSSRAPRRARSVPRENAAHGTRGSEKPHAAERASDREDRKLDCDSKPKESKLGEAPEALANDPSPLAEQAQVASLAQSSRAHGPGELGHEGRRHVGPLEHPDHPI